MSPEQAFDEHHKAIYRFVYRLVGRAELAEDITQDCFVSMLREPQRYCAARGDVKAYLFGIARNLAFKHYRRSQMDVQVDEERTDSIVDERADQELAVTVAQMVAQLPDLQREALILFEYEGFRLQEIAEIVDADVGVVKSRLHRARERLKRVLAPYRKVGAHGRI